MDERETLRNALDERTWRTVNKQLLAKMLAEFAYEELIEPSTVGPASDWEPRDGDGGNLETWTTYELSLDGVRYRYDARKRVFDSYRVDPDAIERQSATENSWSPAEDAIQFLVDVREHVGIDAVTTSHLVREYTHTLLADAHVRSRKDALSDSRSILDMTYPEIECEMEGHPWFTVNKGRIGFGYDDYLRFAPEQRTPQSLYWLGVRRDRATFTSVSGLDYDTLVDEEVGSDRPRFERRLSAAGGDPCGYYLLPVHQWQWNNVVAQLFAGDIATGDIVPLGTGSDDYLPQQSVRTLTNVDTPERHHVKLPLSILNTMVYRGLPGEMARNAPRVTEYVTGIRDDDPFLSDECDVVLPGEVASIDYTHSAYEQIGGTPYQYDELLGVVWRESVSELIEDDEQPIPLSALLHADIDGTPFAARLAERAGLSLGQWLDELFDALFPPLLHYLFRYGVGFMPHGTNVILILSDDTVNRIAIKDFVDEIAVSERWLPELDRLSNDLYETDAFLDQQPPDLLSQRILGTVFICVFRYVSELLEREEGYPESTFWQQVHEAIDRYQAGHPELADRFETFDLYRSTFSKGCLNRSRLIDHGYEDRTDEPSVSRHGTVPNVLANFDDRA